MKGYQGKTLRVDLSSGKISTEPITEEMVRKYLGGDGFLAYYLFNELKGKEDPLGEKNKLIIATGPLTGTLWPTSGRFVMGSHSPLTGFWGESNCGGFFGPELKAAGYDALIIEGSAKKPVMINIQDSEVVINDAKHLWGRDTRDVTLELQKGDPETQVLCIGIAGEKKVRYACVISNLYRAFGRAGMGAVWGSKNLKAITVRGNKKITVAKPEEFYKHAFDAHQRVIKSPQGRQMFRYGTNLLVSAKQAIGELITRNHSNGVFEGADKLAAEYLAEKYQGRPRACFGCSNACKEVYVSSKDNPWMQGFTVEGPEYEGTAFFGSNLGIDDYDFILYVSDLCNRYGYDQISVGAVLSFIVECMEQGIVNKKEVDGLELGWGRKESIIELMHKIAKREGIGDILAEGVKRAAEKIKRGSEKYALHVKGQEISGQDGRTHRSVALTHAVGARGADHLRSLVTVDQLGYKEAAGKRYKKLLEGKNTQEKEKILNDLCNPYSEKYKAYAVKVTEDVFCIRDSLVVCWYTCGWPPIFWIDDFANVMPSVTGEEAFGSVEELFKIGERIQNVKRLFNLREGLTSADDTLPERFTKEPMPSGPGKGQVANLKIMLDEYYRQRGWDRKTGKIKPETLKRLDLLKKVKR
ncbi:MAG: aldehyde ferredoxin oxidoreductase family protein [Elusimicrobiota bacterium]